MTSACRLLSGSARGSAPGAGSSTRTGAGARRAVGPLLGPSGSGNSSTRPMPNQTRDVSPGGKERQVKTEHGELLDVPAGWVLLPPGDAALSRRVKSEGPSWCVKEKKGRKVFSRGIWAPRERIERITHELALERANPAYQRKLDAGRQRRAAEQVVYAGDFEAAVRHFFASPTHTESSPARSRESSLPTPSRSAAAPWPAPTAYRSSGARRPPASRGCDTRRPPTTTCKFRA